MSIDFDFEEIEVTDSNNLVVRGLEYEPDWFDDYDVSDPGGDDGDDDPLADADGRVGARESESAMDGRGARGW